MGAVDNLFDRIDSAERIRNVSDGYELRLLAQQRVVFIHQQFARVVHRNDAQPGALLFAEHLPRNNVGVMLHRRDDDFVARTDEFAAVAVHHEVYAFGRPAHKNALLRIARIDEALDLFASAFVSGRRFHAEIVHAAMNVRMFLGDVLRAAFDYHRRYLR